jgi:hypothetical protein
LACACRDDQIILSAILFYLGALHLPGGQNLPLWRTDGAVLIALLHAGPTRCALLLAAPLHALLLPLSLSLHLLFLRF